MQPQFGGGGGTQICVPQKILPLCISSGLKLAVNFIYEMFYILQSLVVE